MSLPETQLSKQSLGKYCLSPELQLLESGNMVLSALFTYGEPHSGPAPYGGDHRTVLSLQQFVDVDDYGKSTNSMSQSSVINRMTR